MPADLSDTAALAWLAAALPQAPVISSDLSRAVATADAILAGRPRLPHHPGLREIDFGAWDMQPHAEIADQARLRRYWEDPWTNAPPGGESLNETARRVNKAVDEVMATHPGDLILVAHFGVILTQLRRVEGLTEQAVLAQRIDNLSITELVLARGAWRAVRVNHLPVGQNIPPYMV